MSDGHSEMQLREQSSLPAIPAADDGWNDAAREANERMIRGQLLKFADWRWTTGKEATPIENGTKLVALATAAAWVKWKDNKPVQSIMREKGRRLPEREELGDMDQDQWEEQPDGSRKDPYQSTRFV